MEKSLHAIVLGATGLVGSALVQQLITDDRFNKISLIGRRPCGLSHQKIVEHHIDFDNPEKWQDIIKGDILFSAFGTTIKKAGSQEQQYKIDFTYQYEVAKAAANNGVKQYVLISSAGANAKSSIFYSRMKGELDDKVKTLAFDSIHLIKPSVLAGERKEQRTGERIGITVGNIICKIPGLKAYRPITDNTVAKAMVNTIPNTKQGIFTYSLDEVHELAK